MSKSKIAVFKPLNKLTFWVCLLAVIYVASIVAVNGLFVAAAVNVGSELGDVLTEFMALAMLTQLVFLVVSGITSLSWFYGAARNAKVLRPSFSTSPGWAVGWFFVPFANLFKPFETLRDIWIASKGKINDRYSKGSAIIVWWWVLSLIGNASTNLSSRLGAFDEDSFYEFAGAEYTYITGNAVLLVSTVLFIFAVRDIWNFQKNHTADAAEVF